VTGLQEHYGRGLGCPLGSLITQLADDQGGRLALVNAFATWQGRLRDGLAAMRTRGELAESADLDALALGLLTATQGGLLLAQTTRSVRPLQVALDMALERVRAGLTAPAPVAAAAVAAAVP